MTTENLQEAPKRYELNISPDYREQQLDRVIKQAKPDDTIRMHIRHMCMFAIFIICSIVMYIYSTHSQTGPTFFTKLSPVLTVAVVIVSVTGIVMDVIRCYDLGEDYDQFVWLATIPRRDFIQCQKLIELTEKIYKDEDGENLGSIRQLFLLIAFKPGAVEFSQKCDDEALGVMDTLTYKPFPNYPGVCTLTMPDDMFQGTFKVSAARIDLE